MQDEEYEEEEEEMLDLDSIEDEHILIEMLDEAEDFDERKRIRDRLRKVQFVIKAQHEGERRQREIERDEKVKNRLRAADEQKQRTLAMYDQMAKSAPAGGNKQIDINLYKNSQEGTPAPEGLNSPKRDLVEETIKARVKAADDRKKRLLAAYDHAAKSQPSGNARIVHFDEFKSANVSKLEPPPQVKGSCTFGMSGGVPKVVKAPTITSPAVGGPKPGDDSHLDPMERAIRARQREADERKARTLAAYDIVAKRGGAGPKTVILEEFRDLEVSPDMKLGCNYAPTACFKGGIIRNT